MTLSLILWIGIVVALIGLIMMLWSVRQLFRIEPAQKTPDHVATVLIYGWVFGCCGLIVTGIGGVLSLL